MHFHWGAFLNPLVSLFDEEARRITRSLASSVPEDSWFRTERFRRFFDVARGAVEKGFHFDNKALETFKEKLADYGDYFTTALGGAPVGEPSRAEAVKAAKDWMDKFSVEAQARLGKTPLEKLEEESQRILLEFELRRGFYEALDEAMKKARGEITKPEPEEEVWIDWDKIQSQFRIFLRGTSRFTAKAVNQTEKAAKAADHWAANTAAPRAQKLRVRLEELDRKEAEEEKKKKGVRKWLNF